MYKDSVSYDLTHEPDAFLVQPVHARLRQIMRRYAGGDKYPPTQTSALPWQIRDVQFGSASQQSSNRYSKEDRSGVGGLVVVHMFTSACEIYRFAV